MSSSVRNVVVFRLNLLAFSETFIREQGERLTGYCAYYSGLREIAGLELPAERVCLAPTVGWAAKPANFLHKLGLPHPRLLERMKAVNPVLMHAHFEADGICAMAFAEELKIPLVTTCHGFDVTVYDRDRRWTERLAGLKRAQLQRKGRLFIAVSGFIREKMIERGYPPDKILQHYIGVDSDLFQRTNLEPREPMILFVGRLVQKKGVGDLLAASELLKHKQVEHSVVVIGVGPLGEQLQRVARDQNLPVKFLGRQSPEEIRRWMDRAAIFCGPSKTALNGDSEGFGMVFAEAQAMELPIVATRHGGIPEAVQNGETGLLVREGNPDELADALHQLLTNPRMRAEMGKSGRQRVLDKFDLQKQTLKLEKIYSGLLEENRSWTKKMNLL